MVTITEPRRNNTARRTWWSRFTQLFPAAVRDLSNGHRGGTVPSRHRVDNRIAQRLADTGR